MREHHGSLPLRGPGDCGSRPLRFGAAIGRHMQGTAEFAPGTRHQRLDLLAAKHAGPGVIGARHLEPGGEADFIVFGFAHVHDAAFAKAGGAARQPIHVAPQTQALHDQRHLARVAARLPAPAPVAAGLFAADVALLAQRHGDAACGQRQRSRRADDAAADDDDSRGRGNCFIRCNRIDVWAHELDSPNVSL